ncbi:MAG: hypothetical protein ACK5SX_06675 [Sandaracinobacter sp.]
MSDPVVADPYSALRPRLAAKLAGFSAAVPDSADRPKMISYRPDRSRFPVPELVLFALRDVLGWRWYGAGEKVRWTVSGAIDGQPIAFELRKFGFTIFRPEGREDLDERIQGQLQSALREVERFLAPVAERQVALGEVLIVNRFIEFDGRYRFFRQLADDAYARGAGPVRKNEHGPADTSVARLNEATRAINAKLAATREGFFYSTAMVDSYFSSLEHRLVLLRAFTGTPLAEGELLRLLAAKWNEKLKMILTPPFSRDVESALGRMRRIKERIRNPFAHGGVENDKGSLFFHLPKIGAIPANFTHFEDSVRFSVLPVDADDHAESCATFDALDALLSTGRLAGPDQLLKGSVDPSFDAKTLAEYADALAGGAEAVEAFIEHWSSAWERHVNMDY